MARQQICTVLLAALAAGCVRVDSGCKGMTISPSAWSARIGQSRVFTATAQGVVDPAIQWTMAASAGQLTQFDLQPNQVRVVLGASSGTFLLRARSIADPSRTCICGLSATDFSFSFTRPIRFPGNDDTVVVGDVAIGTPAATPLARVPGTGRVYVASLTDDGGNIDAHVQQFDVDEFFSSSPTPLFDTAGSGFTPGFDATTNLPLVVADTAGNGYWIDDRNGTGRIGIIRANATEGRGVDTFDLVSQANVGLASNAGLAVDAHGDVFITGFFFGGSEGYRTSTTLLRISGVTGGAVSVATLNSTPSGPASRLAVDPEGRVYVLTYAFDGKGGPSLNRYLADGGFDRSFAPLSDVLDGAYDVGVDAHGGVYVLAKCPTCDPVVRIVDALGHLVRTVSGPGGSSTFESVVGLGVASDGTFVLVDDVQSSEESADVIVVEP